MTYLPAIVMGRWFYLYLILANACDAVTARLFGRLGFAAVATTSGGVA